MMDKELEEAALNMQLKYLDYLDNSGSRDSDEFWRDFERAREEYREIKEKS